MYRVTSYNPYCKASYLWYVCRHRSSSAPPTRYLPYPQPSWDWIHFLSHHNQHSFCASPKPWISIITSSIPTYYVVTHYVVITSITIIIIIIICYYNYRNNSWASAVRFLQLDQSWLFLCCPGFLEIRKKPSVLHGFSSYDSSVALCTYWSSVEPIVTEIAHCAIMACVSFLSTNFIAPYPALSSSLFPHLSLTFSLPHKTSTQHTPHHSLPHKT